MISSYCARHHANYIRNFTFEPIYINSVWKVLLLFPTLWKNNYTRVLRNFSKVIQLIGEGARIYTHMALLSKRMYSKNVKRNNVFYTNSPHCGTYNRRISETED